MISAITLPSGGTSDYAPEMIHAAAQGEPYHCFVRPETRIPFMAMPDAIKALLHTGASAARAADAPRLQRDQLQPVRRRNRADRPKRHSLAAQIDFAPDTRRQGIVDTWRAQVDDSAARRDWGWQPDYDLDSAFKDYLIPTIRQRYA